MFKPNTLVLTYQPSKSPAVEVVRQFTDKYWWVSDDPAKLTGLGILGRKDFGDSQLERLGDAKNLEVLRLDGTSVTDAGLKHLHGFSKLKNLMLSGTSVTDAGLEHLGDLKTLVMLDLIGTKCTPQGIEMLKKSLPLLSVRLRAPAP
jgi:hypothetical protein